MTFDFTGAEVVLFGSLTGEVDPAGEVLRYDHLVAGLLEAVDVDPAVQLPGVQPFRGFRV